MFQKYNSDSVFLYITQLNLTLCDPMDCSLPGSSIHGIFQARVLEWGAIDEFAIVLCHHGASQGGQREFNRMWALGEASWRQ